jgi:O-antigen/teichoic acid export membrane protein
MTWWLVAASWPAYLTLATFAPLVLRAFGADFTSGQNALVILSLAMMVNLGTGNVQVVLLMGGRSAWQLFNVGVALVLNVGLNLVLIPRLGIAGAALAWAVSIVFDNLATIVEVRLLLGIRSFGTGYPVVAVGAAVCFGLLGVLLRAAMGPTVPALLILLTAGTAGYAWVLWRFRRPLRGAILWDAIRGRAGREWRAGAVPDGRPAARRVGA